MNRIGKPVRITLVLLSLTMALWLALAAGCSKAADRAAGGAEGTTGSAAQSSAKDASAASAASGGFREFPVGDEHEAEGMKIGAVYFQPVHMEPADKAGLKADQSDIHLEADIAALKDNKVGFGAGEFIPYLTVNYRLVHLDSGKEAAGTFMPMNAGDGAHYGANVKMAGAGKYKLTFSIESPEKKDYLLHVDKETGVEGRFWTKPVEVSWEFNWVPRKW